MRKRHDSLVHEGHISSAVQELNFGHRVSPSKTANILIWIGLKNYIKYIHIYT